MVASGPDRWDILFHGHESDHDVRKCSVLRKKRVKLRCSMLKCADVFGRNTSCMSRHVQHVVITPQESAHISWGADLAGRRLSTAREGGHTQDPQEPGYVQTRPWGMKIRVWGGLEGSGGGFGQNPPPNPPGPLKTPFLPPKPLENPPRPLKPPKRPFWGFSGVWGGPPPI